MIWEGEETYNRTTAVFVLAFPFLRFLRGDDNGRCGLLRRLVVRSVPIRHSKTNPEDEKTEGKRKESGWMLDQKFWSISSPPSLASAINGDCRAS